jgi:hypothetical protein
MRSRSTRTHVSPRSHTRDRTARRVATAAPAASVDVSISGMGRQHPVTRTRSRLASCASSSAADPTCRSRRGVADEPVCARCRTASACADVLVTRPAEEPRRIDAMSSRWNMIQAYPSAGSQPAAPAPTSAEAWCGRRCRQASGSWITRGASTPSGPGRAAACSRRRRAIAMPLLASLVAATPAAAAPTPACLLDDGPGRGDRCREAGASAVAAALAAGPVLGSVDVAGTGSPAGPTAAGASSRAARS